MRLSRLVLVISVCIGMGISTVHAALTAVGTATYLGKDYKLIYDSAQNLVWLDYTKDSNTWQEQDLWVSNLGESLTVTLNPGYTTDIDWTGGWRLPETGGAEAGHDGITAAGYNVTSSEMGHLFYTSLGNLGRYATDGTEHPSGTYGLNETGPFESLYELAYWFGGTERIHQPDQHWYFYFKTGYQTSASDGTPLSALAVHEGSVSIVPVPGAIVLGGFGAGLVGWLRRRQVR